MNDYLTNIEQQEIGSMDSSALYAIVGELFAAIHGLSGYAVPTAVPDVHSVPVSVMQQKLCSKPCAVKAFYHPDWGVYLDEMLDIENDPFDRSVLLHELVHHLQNTSGRFERMPVSCERNHLAEAEAYRIQNLYLSSVNSPRRALFTGWAAGCARTPAATGEP